MFSTVVNYLINAVSPSPSPMELNAENVNPGPMAGVVFTALAISLLVLLFSMNRHIKRINFKEDNDSE